MCNLNIVYICNVNNLDMKERILQFLQAENKSSSQFAEEIGVQPSGISHIISGRNNPSLDFIIKMLTRYNYLSSEWLMFGKGNMYKNQMTQELFDNDLFKAGSGISDNKQKTAENAASEKERFNIDLISDDTENQNIKGLPEKIVYFYKNRTFREYYPGK
jgi:transcriptional regulator with XRE-family HTH domain